MANRIEKLLNNLNPFVKKLLADPNAAEAAVITPAPETPAKEVTQPLNTPIEGEKTEGDQEDDDASAAASGATIAPDAAVTPDPKADPKADQKDEQPASIEELETILEEPALVLACYKAKHTAAQAMMVRIETLKQQVAAKPVATPASATADPLAALGHAGKGGAAAIPESPRPARAEAPTYESEIERRMAAGMSREQAVLAVNAEDAKSGFRLRNDFVARQNQRRS